LQLLVPSLLVSKKLAPHASARNLGFRFRSGIPPENLVKRGGFGQRSSQKP
jgi:hypothetical protein